MVAAVVALVALLASAAAVVAAGGLSSTSVPHGLRASPGPRRSKGAHPGSGNRRTTLHMTRDLDAVHRHHRQLRQARRLGVFDSVSIFGPFRTLAYFYVDVYLGTPPQKATVIADTGSNLLALPCSGCGHCGPHMDPKFDAAASSTATFYTTSSHPGVSSCRRCLNGDTTHCCYAISYAEGSSLHGTYVRDVTWLGSDESSAALEASLGVPFHFGCHTSENGLFLSQLADGIMGLSPDTSTLIGALHAANKLDHNLFTMCVLPFGGVMNIGDMDEALHTSPVQYTPFTSSTFYHVSVTAVALSNGVNISPNTVMRAIVDSGTSFTYLPPSQFHALVSQITTYCTNLPYCIGQQKQVPEEELCFIIDTVANLKTFPSLSLEFTGGATIVIPPEGLFVHMDWFDTDDCYCLGVYNNHVSSAVLGANSMFYHDVVFDLDNKRVGWAESRCGYPANYTGPPQNNDNAVDPEARQHALGVVSGGLAIAAVAMAMVILSRTRCMTRTAFCARCLCCKTHREFQRLPDDRPGRDRGSVRLEPTQMPGATPLSDGGEGSDAGGDVSGGVVHDDRDVLASDEDSDSRRRGRGAGRDAPPARTGIVVPVASTVDAGHARHLEGKSATGDGPGIAFDVQVVGPQDVAAIIAGGAALASADAGRAGPTDERSGLLVLGSSKDSLDSSAGCGGDGGGGPTATAPRDARGASGLLDTPLQPPRARTRSRDHGAMATEGRARTSSSGGSVAAATSGTTAAGSAGKSSPQPLGAGGRSRSRTGSGGASPFPPTAGGAGPAAHSPVPRAATSGARDSGLARQSPTFQIAEGSGSDSEDLELELRG